MEDWRKGGLNGTGVDADSGGSLGGGEKDSACSVSWSRIAVNESTESHGGGRILARRWRLSRRASQSGRGARCGGLSGGEGPYGGT